jgi:transposase InsO family protein
VTTISASPGSEPPHRTKHITAALARLSRDDIGVRACRPNRLTGADRAYPKTIRLDNGPEFISRELDLWAFLRGVTRDFSRPGKPTDNAFIESMNGKFRGDCLNANWFMTLDEARRKCEAWRRDYNEVRPHSAIGNEVPASLHRSASNPGQLAAR